MNEKHTAWLEARGLSVEIAAKHGVRAEGPWLAFPYFLGGREIYRKRRSVERKDFNCAPSGVPQTALWNEQCLAEPNVDNSPLIITEGEADALAFLQAGYQFVVSVPSGAKEPGKAQNVHKHLAENGADEGPEVSYRLKPAIAAFGRIIVAVDNDVAGLDLRSHIVAFIGDEFCWLPRFPTGCKDGNDVLRDFGVDAVRSMVDAAVPVMSDGFVALNDIEDQAKPKTYSTGFPYLDVDRPEGGPSMALLKPEFVVIGGMAGHGKSTITQALTFSLCLRHGWRASIFHGEGSQAIVLMRARKFWRHATNSSTSKPEQVARREAWIRDHLALIKPAPDELPTFEWLMKAMEFQATHRKRDIFVIDPWNEVLMTKPKNVSTTEYVAECIIRMKRMAEKHKIVLIVSHHVSKPMDPRKPPNRYDLADSAHWVNKADHLLLAWKPREDQNKTRLEIAKSKDHDLQGMPGHLWVSVNGDDFAMTTVAPPLDETKQGGDPKQDLKQGAAEATTKPRQPRNIVPIDEHGLAEGVPF